MLWFYFFLWGPQKTVYSQGQIYTEADTSKTLRKEKESLPVQPPLVFKVRLHRNPQIQSFSICISILQYDNQWLRLIIHYSAL